jgi:hypothetical protein
VASTTDRDRRLRLKKLTLRTLTADETAQVGGGGGHPVKHAPPGHTNSPNDTRYCLEI